MRAAVLFHEKQQKQDTRFGNHTSSTYILRAQLWVAEHRIEARPQVARSTDDSYPKR